ncbi:MAG: c-type cytochrome [Candidatus Hydrogenedentes bacterium]|nr:c-type cytochrome [Candidatus Hydrogenedentota bacterium]
MSRRWVSSAALIRGALVSLMGLTGTAWALEAPAPPAPKEASAPAAAVADTTAKPAPAPPGADQAASDSAAAGFMMKCAACHTVGRGPLVGPDLKTACGWPSKDLSAAIKRMEKNVGPLKDEETASLVELLHAPELQTRLTAELQRMALRQTVKMEPASAAKGKNLFEGSDPLTNGGVACMACHRANGMGGTLAKDLTGIFALRGQAALQSACENTSFPVMKAAFRQHPVTKQEAFHLVKYFESLQQVESARSDPAVAGIGMGGAALAFGLIGLAYRGRNRGIRARLMAKSLRRNGS